MSAPFQPTSAGGFAPPPFLARSRGRSKVRGWWSGITGHGRIALSACACLAIAMVVVLVVSAGAGNGANRVRTHPRPQPSTGTLTLISDSAVRNLETVRVSLLSYRLKTILARLAAVAPAVERKLRELSRVVQGARCEGYIALVFQVSDAGKAPARASGDIPEDPEGVWRYANGLADTYLPIFKQCQRELESLRPGLVEVGTPRPMKKPRDLLLQSCDLQLEAARAFVRGLKLIKDCNEMTVGQALEIVQSAAADVEKGTACLNGAVDSLASND